MPPRVAKAVCARPLHQKSVVTGAGVFVRAAGRYQRYRCRPPVGDPHYFSVGIDGNRRRRSVAGSPPCLDHPGSTIVRNGPYRGSTDPDIDASIPRRQRYQCTHTGSCNDTCRKGCDAAHPGPCRFACRKTCDGSGHPDEDHFVPCRASCDGAHGGPCERACRRPCDGTHTFTPPLPRAHVHSGERCADCLELRGYHRGEVAAARRHRWPARIAAKALNDLSLGLSYGRVGKETVEAAKIPLEAHRRAAPATPPKRRVRWSKRKARKRSPATRFYGRFWQIAAGFVEAFAPILWAEAERRMREREAASALLGPVVWILDEIPVYGLDESGHRKKTDGYSVLVLAELDWTSVAQPGALRLRLIRALPKSTAPAWRLLFAEVGGRPDIVLSDGATPILSAVRKHWATQPFLVPSTFHITQALANNSLRAAVRGRDAAGHDLRAHLRTLGRDHPGLQSVAGWHQWWDELERLAIATGRVKIGDLRGSRANYEDRMAAVLPMLLADPRLPISTGGLEASMRTAVGNIMNHREQHFGNVERTNNLLDLAICRAEGLFSDLNEVARLIEADETPHRGWTVPLRAIADPLPRVGVYRSLRDEHAMNQVAEDRNLL